MDAKQIESLRGSIQYITIMPRNKRFCRYVINDSEEMHTMTYDDIRHLILSLCPQASTHITELMNEFRFFVVDVVDQVVHELSFDPREDKIKMRQALRNYDFRAIEREMVEEKTKGQDPYHNLSRDNRLADQLYRFDGLNRLSGLKSGQRDDRNRRGKI